ncbi:permease prefix domain 1-containing protein [Actinomadura madurae]|uniref:permease prefix domain 1-containing protein n=1 Tax=Actinomadura madurae TaxID=1993 RepID=UPI0020271D43|nr:permease prefix domain 1-containing protein [Actinomadura madurae]MCP9947945.1 permease prefix domain 1-containing protein [Actinomadura madurae]MCP9977191.1 permease prefix domain 1-containing protein [Actinomadura madurae]URM93609.1 permease prefix domain 1-containing protein [Actinomadura madurae]URN04331.1 permease prefix domain 1-containing protein [Actinomadura madurae]
MTAPGADPVEACAEEYAAALAGALRGPARAKARMVEEIRDGFADTVTAHAGAGLPHEHAVRRAVHEFGTAEELAPGCQRELTIAQTRRTARAAALAVPCLTLCWLLIWTSGPGHGWPLRLLAVHVACVAVTAGLLAAATLAATGPVARRVPVPARLPLAVAWAGTASAVAMGLAALALVVSSALAGDWPLMVLSGGFTAASHAVVAGSSRACRECARLPGSGAAHA